MISGSPRERPGGDVADVVGGSSATVPTIQSFSLAALPGGAPGTVQPSSPDSKDVEPSPVETTMSSTKTPWRWTMSSLA